MAVQLRLSSYYYALHVRCRANSRISVRRSCRGNRRNEGKTEEKYRPDHGRTGRASSWHRCRSSRWSYNWCRPRRGDQRTDRRGSWNSRRRHRCGVWCTWSGRSYECNNSRRNMRRSPVFAKLRRARQSAVTEAADKRGEFHHLRRRKSLCRFCRRPRGIRGLFRRQSALLPKSDNHKRRN